MDDIIKSHKVIVCAGSGGVGKTTVAASVGLRAAQLGLKALVLTIDPARRLATALGIKAAGEAVQVNVQDASGQLWAEMINPDLIFDQFIENTAPDKDTVDRIKNNKLYHQLSTTLSGSQEFTSLVKLHDAVSSGDYDLVILDTPPAQHAVDFLNAPEKIYSLFQSTVTKWFIREKGQQPGFFKKLVNRGTQTVLGVFEKITGSEFMGELSEFFLALTELQDEIGKKSISTHRLLVDDKTTFVLVTSFDESKLQEAETFHKYLRRGGYSLASVIINRAFPEWFQNADPDQLAQAMQVLPGDLQRQGELRCQYFDRRRNLYKRFQFQYSESLRVVTLPELNSDAFGLQGLARIADYLTTSED